jgi:hypothetical protein
VSVSAAAVNEQVGSEQFLCGSVEVVVGVGSVAFLCGCEMCCMGG